MNSIVKVPSLFNSFDVFSNLDKIFGNLESPKWESTFSHMSQISENRKDGKYEVSFEVPGFDENQLKVRNENNVLNVSGSIEADEESSHLSRKVDLSVRIPIDVESTTAKANLSKGVLTVSFELKENASSEIPINNIDNPKESQKDEKIIDVKT